MSFLPLVRIWIIAAALASVAGWILSALGRLTLTSYTIVALLGAVLVFLARRELVRGGKRLVWGRMKRRFTRPFPLVFAGLALLVFLGGALYQPSNYDGLAYRVPRVLHWLAREQWHWIHTTNFRMNDRSCGFEWLIAPILVATRSDRAIFLVNFLPFLLLPGLVFSVFTRLGVSARVAWHWMWLLPTGYNFLLQAGSLGNDAFAAVYVLAAVDFALRAAASRRLADIWLSLLAAALLTGAKTGNLPLLLPWFILFFPLVPKLWSKPVASLAVVLMALLASFVPTAGLNHLHCGDWTGLTLESPVIVMQHPLLGILGNSVVFLTSNFVPTFFPLAGWWNHSALSFLPDKISALLRANFEGDFYKLGEIPTEEMAGLGFGLCALLAITAWAAFFICPPRAVSGSRRQVLALLHSPYNAVMASSYVALVFFFAKSGMMTLARLVSAYYPLLLPALICGPKQAIMIRCRWWRRLALAMMVLAYPVVILTPARPLWPVRTIFSIIGDMGSEHHLFKRIKDVYLVYADRPDPLAQVRAALPEDCALVGFLGESNDTEISLWRPYGRRRVEDILPDESWSQIRARQIQYAVVGGIFLNEQHLTIQTWLQLHHASLVQSITATLIVSDGPRPWHIVRFD